VRRSERRLAAREAAKELVGFTGTPQTSAVGRVIQSASKSTIYPFAEDLEAYNLAIPNGAERLFNNFDKQANHRQEIEQRVIDSNIKQAERGQLLGFLTIIVALVAAAGLAVQGHDMVASVIVSIVLAGGFGVFITGKVHQRQDLRRKQREQATA
jgi:uncharacterized membrane protein